MPQLVNKTYKREANHKGWRIGQSKRCWVGDGRCKEEQFKRVMYSVASATNEIGYLCQGSVMKFPWSSVWSWKEKFVHSLKVYFLNKKRPNNSFFFFHQTCAAKAFYSCPAMISRRPGSQDTSKESQLNPEEDSRIKQARSHVFLTTGNPKIYSGNHR
jgi:hypothetical protein